jgi:hypothetical protein
LQFSLLLITSSYSWQLSVISSADSLSAQGQWVVADTNATAEQIAQRIGLEGRSGQFVVFSIAGYFGYYRKDLWEWLTINSG